MCRFNHRYASNETYIMMMMKIYSKIGYETYKKLRDVGGFYMRHLKARKLQDFLNVQGGPKVTSQRFELIARPLIT